MSSFSPKPDLAFYSTDGRQIVLDRELAKGGEGSVWGVRGRPEVVAKFYHQGVSPEQARKLDVMCRLKSDSLLRIAAWPIDLVKATTSGSAQGFLMRRISGYEQVHLLYTPKSRRTHFPEAQLPFILHTSANIVRAFATVHDAGQTIGDVNHGNLLVSKDGTVALIDCDSFEIIDGNRWFSCPVGVPTYTPPELQGKSFAGIRRTQQHDAFGLAVLIFHMLFLGRHPFSGIFRQGTDNTTVEEAIREFRFAYSPDKRLTEMEQPAWVPPLAIYPADLGNLFVRAFGRDGVNGKRPTAHEWVPAIENVLRNLKQCPANESHYHPGGLSSCPWCRAEDALGITMFGYTVTTVRSQNFDLVAIWSQIESIQPDESATPVYANAYTNQCRPDPKIKEIRSARRNLRAISIGSLLLAILIVASAIQVLPAIASIGILAAGLAAMVTLWRRGDEGSIEFEQARRHALRSFQVAQSRWSNVEKVPAAFIQVKTSLEAQKREFEQLPALKAQRMAQLQSEVRNKQLQRWLEKHKIEAATIPNIGQGRKNTLRAYGIEDASDIHYSMQIKGFGDSLKSNLWGWRVSVEQRFVFNPKEGMDPADMRTLNLEIEQKGASLAQALSSGPLTLKNILLPWKVERDSALANFNGHNKAVAQAEVNQKELERW
jgi:DNA-binding helix-hairpin-helix protein with protein kinase domain